jgi:hypothetical protein
VKPPRVVPNRLRHLVVKIKSLNESAVVEIDVDAQVGYVSAHSAILILLIFVGGPLLLQRKGWRPRS